MSTKTKKNVCIWYGAGTDSNPKIRGEREKPFRDQRAPSEDEEEHEGLSEERHKLSLVLLLLPPFLSHSLSLSSTVRSGSFASL